MQKLLIPVLIAGVAGALLVDFLTKRKLESMSLKKTWGLFKSK